MLLGALVGAGVPVGVLVEAVDKVAPGQVGLEVVGGTPRRLRGDPLPGRARRHRPTHRTWRDVEELLNGAGLHEDVRSLAHDVFSRLAEAEGRVHGQPAEDVHFHEVGALDAIADVVGVCAGFVHLGLDRVVVSEVSVGGGTVSSEHGRLPVPPPAVVELLRGVPSSGGPVDLELCTPTGAALLTTLADGWGPQPAMAVHEVGVGAGARDPEGHANVLRAARWGAATSSTGARSSTTDGRGSRCCWRPTSTTSTRGCGRRCSAALLEAGASDAWLTPILMKKGRPAHTLSVLVATDRADGVRREVYRQTSTIGLREQRVGKHELDRSMATVELDGHTIGVKVARLDGEVVNVQPEFEDVAAAARALGRPVKTVMAEAIAAARGAGDHA